MKAYLKELQGKLLGTVTDHPDTLEHFSTDAGLFQVQPAAVVYPQNTADVRKMVQFVAERTASGKPTSIVPRGLGSNQCGAAVGEGLQVSFPAHMNKLLKLDTHTVTVQPGIVYSALQQTLHTHNRWLPPYPDSANYSTIGGAVACNSAGVMSLKYGPTRSFVRSLKVVLSDGSLIKTRRLSARELNRKKGLATLEGEIYRKIDAMLLDHPQLIKKRQPRTGKNVAGYALDTVRGQSGSFDLGQLFVGAQGTLGLITEVTMTTAPYNPRTTLVAGYFSSVEQAAQAVVKLRPLKPCAVELVDRQLLETLRTNRPVDLEGLVPDDLPIIMLFVEFDEPSQISQKYHSVRAERIMARHGAKTRVSTDPVEQVALWKLRQAGAGNLVVAGAKQPLPFIDDAAVPAEKLAQFLHKTTQLLAKYDLTAPVWGHAGDGHLHLQPHLDLRRKKDVDKLFNLSREFHDMVIALGGTPAAELGDGLVRGPYLEKLYGEEMLELFASVKHIFDPLGIFNPGKKSAATESYARSHLRSEYSLAGFSDFVVHS
jgi:FAD/FMN-containing dehydrogenase